VLGSLILIIQLDDHDLKKNFVRCQIQAARKIYLQVKCQGLEPHGQGQGYVWAKTRGIMAERDLGSWLSWHG